MRRLTGLLLLFCALVVVGGCMSPERSMPPNPIEKASGLTERLDGSLDSAAWHLKQLLGSNDETH